MFPWQADKKKAGACQIFARVDRGDEVLRPPLNL